MAHAHFLSTWFNANGNAAAPICCPRSTIAPESPQPSFSKKEKLRASKGFQFVSLRPENHIFCFKVDDDAFYLFLQKQKRDAHESSRFKRRHRWH